MMRLLLIIFLLIIDSFSYDVKKADFATFCNYVSYHLDKNIVISEEVPTNFSVFMPNDNMSKNEIEKVFFTILKSKNINYKIIKNTILIYKDIEKPKLNNYIIRYNYIPKQVIKNYISNFYPGLKYQIFQNRLLLFTTYKNYLKINNVITDFQHSYKTAKVNFLISVINNKKVKELGTDLKIKSKFSKGMFDLVTDTASISSSISNDFISFIKFLNSKQAAETISKPTLFLIDSSDYTLESVHSIPIVTKTLSTDNNGNPTTETEITYKDIGLKIYIKNVYITDKSIDFDMSIYIQNIVSYLDTQPVVDSKFFNTHIQLTKKRKSYLIAGLRTITKTKEETGVPGLKNIPLINFFFKSDKENIEDLSFNLFISSFDEKLNETTEERQLAAAPQVVE